MSIVARGLPETKRSLLVFRNEHAIMGLAADSAKNVFVVIASDRVVKKVAPDGTASIIHRSDDPWMPTGVCVDRKGQARVLEYNGNFTARVQIANRQ